MRINRPLFLLCLSLAAASACKRRQSAEGQTGQTANTSTNNSGSGPSGPGISGQNQGQSSVREVPPTPATGCPAQMPTAALGPGTVHNATINTNETWTLEGSPHRFPDGANIQENATVTVAPCAVVLIGDANRLLVQSGGALIAVGDAQHLIRFGSNKNDPQPGDWEGVIFEEGARRSSRIAYATVEHAGHETANGTASGILTNMLGLDLQHVLVRAFRGFGIAATGQGTFSDTSLDITVREGIVGGRDHAGSAWFGSPNTVRTLPAGAYTGNEINEVYVSGSDPIATTGTWRNPGVRYHIADDTDMRVEGPTSPVLTIAAGTTLAFGAGASLSVGWNAEGALVADGANEAGRISFTAAASEPNPGSWEGIYIGERALRARTKLAWVNIAFAAGDSNTDPTCPWNEQENDAALYLQSPIAAENITHVTFSNLPENTAAIARNWRNAPAINYAAPALANNFAQAGTSCKQSPVHVNDGCPENARCE